MKGKRYTEEFKIEAVKQVVERGYSVNQVAERLGVCANTRLGRIVHWVTYHPLNLRN